WNSMLMSSLMAEGLDAASARAAPVRAVLRTTRSSLMPVIEAWDVLYGAVTAVNDFVGRRLPLMTTSHAHDIGRQVPAAYLARCRRLLSGMDLLRQSAMVDLVGVLMRVFFETWLHGMWVALEGQEVIDRLSVDYERQVNKLIRLAGLGLDEVTAPAAE